MMHQEDPSQARRPRSPRRNAIVKQKRRYHKVVRSQSKNDNDNRSSELASSWLVINHSEDNDNSSSSQTSTDVPFEDMLIQSLSSIALSARRDQLNRLEKYRLELKQQERDSLRKPVEHHKDLMPLNDLAMLMSTQLTTAKAKGLFSPIGPKSYSRRQVERETVTASRRATFCAK